MKDLRVEDTSSGKKVIRNTKTGELNGSLVVGAKSSLLQLLISRNYQKKLRMLNLWLSKAISLRLMNIITLSVINMRLG